MGDWFRVLDLGDIVEFLKLIEGSCWMFGLEIEICYIKRGYSVEVVMWEVKLKRVRILGV